MACSAILASTVGLFVLISLSSAQTDINKPLAACSRNDVEAGIYLTYHPNYVQLYVQCSNNNQDEMICAEGTIFDTRISNCNHQAQATNPAGPCSTSTVGRQYPGVCCENYFRCNGEVLVSMTCPSGQVFNAQTGQCALGTCVDHKKCSRNRPPSGIQTPCPLAPDASSPCNFRYIVNGTVSREVTACAEGSRLDVSQCTCIPDPNVPCMRNANNASGAKTPDAQCRASFRVTFDTFRPGTNIPVAVSDKTGATLPDYIQAVGAQYGNGGATLNPNPQTGTLASVYVPAYSNNELANNVIVETTFRATAQGTFEIFSNNHDGACAPTISINGTYNGNTYQIIGLITGTTPGVFNQQQTNSAQFSLNINAGGTDFITLRAIFRGRSQIQAINRGPTGTGNGQVVNGQESGVIGEKLAYNKCGFQFGRGLVGVLRSVVVREACINTDLFST